ncbi:ELM1/GtrOC1 family putative glycosyltransferase [Candidatus Omnitrophota bacterium]
MSELILYYSVKAFGFFVRLLPLPVALGFGRFIGMMAYYFDVKHKSQVYANLKTAFAQHKSPSEIKEITKRLFKNYAMNFIELFRLPLCTDAKVDELVEIQGKEYIDEALAQGKGLILLAMHFGSWEMASRATARLGVPYKVFVKPQGKLNRLDDLLNSYRSVGGSVVLLRGGGTRDFIKSLKNNEVVGMVVDQGGRGGVPVSFFGRQATMSAGAIRMGLKLGVPICFSIIIRGDDYRHRMIFHKPLPLENTGDLQADIESNLKKIVPVMEDFIMKFPSEYMWFYKVWKYSQEAHILILNDGRTGHLRQSQVVARLTKKALEERGMSASIKEVKVEFKSALSRQLFSLLSLLSHSLINQGRLEFLKYFLKKKSFDAIISFKSDFIISCGSSVAGLNYLLSQDCNAKSIAILKPGILGFKRFDLVVMPEHDRPKSGSFERNVIVTQAAPNLVNAEYLEDQGARLLHHFSHLKSNHRTKIGVFIGGDSKSLYLSEQKIKILINQLKGVSRDMKVDILLTTSRRTSEKIEKLLFKELKNDSCCRLFINANKENVPEAVGGILALSDIVVVSGDSVSMVSESATSGKPTLVFDPSLKNGEHAQGKRNKHALLIDRLNERGYIVSTSVEHLGQSILAVIKNKTKTKQMNDAAVIYKGVCRII